MQLGALALLVRDLEHERCRAHEPTNTPAARAAGMADFDMCEMGPAVARGGGGGGWDGGLPKLDDARNAGSVLLQHLDEAGYLEIMSLRGGQASSRTEFPPASAFVNVLQHPRS